MKNRSYLLFKRSKSVSNAIVLRFPFIRHDGTVERERRPSGCVLQFPRKLLVGASGYVLIFNAAR